MDLEQAIVCSVVFIAGIVIGIVIQKIHTNKKIPYGGKIILDYRINVSDMETIQPYNRAHWHEYKKLLFDVEYTPPENIGFYDRTKKFGNME